MAREGQHKAQVVVEGQTSDADAKAAKLSKRLAQLEEQTERNDARMKAFSKALDGAADASKRTQDTAQKTGSVFSGMADRIRVDAVGALSSLKDAAVAAYDTVSDLADESIRTRAVFDNLPFSIDAAAASTQGLVTNMDLATFAVQGARLKVFESSQQFAQFAEAATKLGLSAGIDANSGIESLVAGLGRGSTEMLDNLGVVLKTEEAHRRYAETLGKTKAELTETEKAEAFRKVGIEAVIDAAKDVTVTTDGAAGAVKRFNVELQNLKTEALGGKAPVTDLHDALAELDNTIGLNTKDIATYGVSTRETKAALREMGVSTEQLAKLHAQDLVQAIRQTRTEQFTYLNGLDDQNRLTKEHIPALERQLELLSSTSSEYIILSKALERVRLEEARLATDAMIQQHWEAFNPDLAADFANRQNELAGLFDKPRKSGSDNRTDFEKFLGLGAGAEKTFDELAGRAADAERTFAELQEVLASPVAEPDFEGELERLRAIRNANEEVKLNAALRQAETLDGEIARIDATETALLEHQAFLEAHAQTDADRILLADERARIVHEAEISRRAEQMRIIEAHAAASIKAEEERREAIEKTANTIAGYADRSITSFLSVADARFQAQQAALAQGQTEREAARAGDLAARQATASQLKSIRDIAIRKALFNTAEGIAALAVGNIPGATKHFIAAGIYGSVAAGAGAASKGLQRGITAERRRDSLAGGLGGSAANSSGSSSSGFESRAQERRVPVSPVQASTPSPAANSGGNTIIINGDVIGTPRREFIQSIDRGLKNLGHSQRRVS